MVRKTWSPTVVSTTFKQLETTRDPALCNSGLTKRRQQQPFPTLPGFVYRTSMGCGHWATQGGGLWFCIERGGIGIDSSTLQAIETHSTWCYSSTFAVGKTLGSRGKIWWNKDVGTWNASYGWCFFSFSQKSCLTSHIDRCWETSTERFPSGAAMDEWIWYGFSCWAVPVLDILDHWLMISRCLNF